MKLTNFEPKDIIALITITGCIILLALGRDGTIASICLAITSFYFGHAITKKGDK